MPVPLDFSKRSDEDAIIMTMTLEPAETLLARIRARSARVCVIGLGYVGLPLAECFVRAGYPVLAFDIDLDKVEMLNAGESYIGHIPSARIAELVATGRFEAAGDPGRFAEADALLICVPTPLTDAREPDLSFIVKTAESIRKHLHPGQLVVLESTTYPGTTRDLLQPILESSGLRPGRDFFTAFSPEREDPGNPQHSTRSIPKIVGGIDEVSLRLAVALYEPAVAKVVPVSSDLVAEACKILENTYRAVNIALVNELKVVFDAMGVDIWEVIEAAKTKPFGYHPFYPGPGLGGHCIPIDPFYLTWVARKFGHHTRFIELAGEINSTMPQYVIGRLVEALNDRSKPVKGSRIGILGVAYKKNVDDMRESPALEIMKMLLGRGAVVLYNDPHVPRLPFVRRHKIAMESSPLTEDFLRGLDCAIIVTDHSSYDFAFIVKHAPLIVDTRNATAAVREGREKIIKA